MSINKDGIKMVKLPNTPEMVDLANQMAVARNKKEREVVFTKMQNYLDKIGFNPNEEKQY
jgi:hypothetical protein